MVVIGEEVPWVAALPIVCGPEVVVRHYVPVPRCAGRAAHAGALVTSS